MGRNQKELHSLKKVQLILTPLPQQKCRLFYDSLYALHVAEIYVLSRAAKHGEEGGGATYYHRSDFVCEIRTISEKNQNLRIFRNKSCNGNGKPLELPSDLVAWTSLDDLDKPHQIRLYNSMP